MKKHDLEVLARGLQERLGEYWTINVYSQKECKEQGYPFDPPCAYLEAKFRLASFTIDVDGEMFFGEQWLSRKLKSQKPRERVEEVIRCLHA